MQKWSETVLTPNMHQRMRLLKYLNYLHEVHVYGVASAKHRNKQMHMQLPGNMD